MAAAHPVNEENDLAGLGIDIGDHLPDHGADDALLEPRISRRSGPHCAQIIGQRRERRLSRWGVVAVSCSVIFASTSAIRTSLRFQRVSSSAVTKRFAGSAASYWRNARSAA